MAAKVNWIDGETVNAAAMNLIGTEINKFDPLIGRTSVVPVTNGVDDRAAIQAVLSGGGEVVFPSGGTWIVDPTGQAGGVALSVPSNTRVIIEEGATVQVKPNALGQYRLFDIDNKTNVTIEGAGTLLGDSNSHTGGTGHHGHLINITNGSTNCRVLGPLLIKRAWGDGLFVGGTAVSHDILFDGQIIEDCRREGIGAFWVDGCEIRNQRIFNISLTGFDPAGCPGYGIGIEPNASQYVDYITVDNCYIEDCAGNGIASLGHFGTVSNVTIRDNRIYDCSNNSGATLGAPYGMRVKQTTNAQILNNTIIGTGWVGATSVAALEVDICTRPIVRGGYYGSARGPGVFIDECTDAVISEATVHNNLRRGILVQDSPNTVVRNNDLIDNCTDDDVNTAHVHVFSSDNTVIEGNNFHGDNAGTWVTVLSPSADCLVANNIGVGATPATAMYADTGTRTVARNNVHKGTSVYELWSTGDASQAFHNQLDQTTNYERVRLHWSSNIFNIQAENGGSGSLRPVRLQSAPVVTLHSSAQASTVGTLQVSFSSSTATATQTGVGGTLSSSSGVQYGLSLYPTVNQTSTGGYTALLINPTESGTGSGNKRLIDAQVGSTSKFVVTNTGGVESAQGGVHTFFNTADETTNYERARHFWSSDIYTIATEQGGSGTARTINIAAGSAGSVAAFASSQGPTTGTVRLRVSSSSTANATIAGINGTHTSSSGLQYGLAIAQTVNQSSTAGYTSLLINTTETATGSGAKRLLDLQVGSASKFGVDNAGNVLFAEAANMFFGTSTGTKIGTATSQKLSFWNATPVVQPTTGITGASFTANSGTAVNDASTFDGYTIGKVVAALRTAGLLA